jgi:omega-hydroxypalmitate O-feruloyl transferase
VIKDSLRKLLVLYYPMAGRLGVSEDSRFQIQCEGQGVLFVEAAADCSIAELGQRYRPAPFMTQLVYI